VLELGAGNLAGNFSALVNAFLNLDDLVTQQYLIDIQKSFENLEKSINNDIQQPIIQTLSEVSGILSQLNITSPSYQTTITNIQDELASYQQSIEDLLQQVDQKYTAKINALLTLIKTLKIGYMNEIRLLGTDVKTIFNNFVSDFQNNLLSIDGLKNTILKDVFNIKGSASIIDSIMSQFENSLSKMITDIGAAVDKRLALVALDNETYSRLRNASLFGQINNLTNELNFGFQTIWAQFSSKLQAIRDFEANLTSTLVSNLGQLSTLRKEIEGIKDSVEAKVKLIESSFKDIT
jgi:hypothetical protein